MKYKIKAGDSLAKIAKQHLGDSQYFKALAAYNKIKNPNSIWVGQEIDIPDVESLKAEDEAVSPSSPSSLNPTTSATRSFTIRPDDVLSKKIIEILQESEAYQALISAEDYDALKIANITQLVFSADPIISHESSTATNNDKQNSSSSDVVPNEYIVKRGETLATIAKSLTGSAKNFRSLAEFNKIKDVNKVSIGQVLKIPPGFSQSERESSLATASPKVTNISDKSENYNEVSLQQLTGIASSASEQRLKEVIGPLNDCMQREAINTPLRQAHFIAQLVHESGSFKYLKENLNYSAKALRVVFGKYFKDDAVANEYARKPEKIANRVYADRMGNGDEASGEGWRFCGRGFIQLTGKDNYQRCGESLGWPLLDEPERLEKIDGAVMAAGWYWDSRKLNQYADKDDIKAITKRVNGGYNGLDDREKYLLKAKAALGV